MFVLAAKLANPDKEVWIVEYTFTHIHAHTHIGVGAGFAMAAKLANPDKEVWIFYGDGALVGVSVCTYIHRCL